MDLDFYKAHIKDGLAVLQGRGYFGKPDRDEFLRRLGSVVSSKFYAIAYDFREIHSITLPGIDCLVEGHILLEKSCIPDYLIPHAKKGVRKLLVETGTNEIIYFAEIEGILRRLKSPLPEAQEKVVENCRRRLGLPV